MADDLYATPRPVTNLQLAFPVDLGDLLPPWDLIPEAFRADTDISRPWRTFQRRWFAGLLRQDDVAALTARPGVNLNHAARHLAVLQGSFEPRHEHKEAAVAWLASRWFEVAP